MNLKQSALLSFLGVLVIGCATSYQSTGFTGGYSETQLNDTVYEVSFRGNGYTSRQRASDFALLRSAQLALENGYGYFIILEDETSTENSTYTTPTTSSTTANVFGSGNSAFGTATTTTYGGQTYNISKPGVSNTIMFLEDEPEGGFAYDAGLIRSQLMEKYGIEPESES